MELRTHKFSSLTAKLREDAGNSSQPYYNQAILEDSRQFTQRRVTHVTEVEPGEVWFVARGKGVQRYRKCDGSCDTVGYPIPPVRKPTFAKGNQPKTSLTPRSLYAPSVSALAADPQHSQVLVAARETEPLDNERSRTGGLIIYNYRANTETVMQIRDGLPSNNVTAVSVDGEIAWVGGFGYVAIVDVPKRKVLRVAFVSASRIQRIQLGKKYAWIQVSCGELATANDGAGNARTGIYRVERTVEQTSSVAAR